MQVVLSRKKAPTVWGKGALLSYEQKQINIHINKQDHYTEVQQAARKIFNQGIQDVTLVGKNWDLELSWAFYQGYYSAKKPGKLNFAPLNKNQEQELQNRIKCSDFIRQIVNLPAEELTPALLAKKAAEFISQQVSNPKMLNYKIISDQQLLKTGYVGIWNVGKGSHNPPAMLQLDFNPSLDEKEPVYACLVGKGITFDSGGYSLKPSESMSSMRTDMGGAALLTGVLALAINKKLNKRVKLYLCCADNLVSGSAYRLGDIIHYPNGISAEILNTDAEGRIVLADGLIEASKQKPQLIVDCATLTGAAKVAVGNEYHAVLSMDDDITQQLLEIATKNKELFWRLPFAEFHRQQIGSNFADIGNTASVPMPAGASTATAFLSYFVKNYQKNWLHIDCAATYRKSANQLWAAGATAYGMLTLTDLLLKNTINKKTKK